MSPNESKRVTLSGEDKKVLLEKALAKYQDRLKKWVQTHGKGVKPPIVWTGLDWVWANRKDMRELRRAQSKRKTS